MKKIILVLLILIIIIFIYILLLKKEQYKNKKITKLKDVILYGDDIDIKTTQNEFDIKNICIYTNDEDKTCLNLTNNNNKELPRPEGQRGQCTVNDCTVCRCPNGLPADKNSTPSCNKKSSDTDKVQCKACKMGYALTNQVCLPCLAQDNLFQDQPLHMGGCSRCEVSDLCPDTHKLVDCGFKSNGKCVKKECKCTNGNEDDACKNEDEQFCKSCNAGYYLNGNICSPCLGTTCPPGQWRSAYSCNDGPTCKDYTSCPEGIRKNGTATSDRECKKWREFVAGGAYDRNGSMDDGDMKNAWVDSIGKDGNLYSYVVYGDKVWYYVNRGPMETSNWSLYTMDKSDWMFLGHDGSKIQFMPGEVIHMEHPINCTAHALKWPASRGRQQTFEYSAGIPNIGNNGICHDGEDGKWSRYDTRVRKLWWMKRILR